VKQPGILVQIAPIIPVDPYMHATTLLNSFDLSILTFLTGFANRSHVFDHLVNALSRLDMFKGIALMCLFWYTWAEAPANETILGREEREKRLIRVLIGTILLGAISRGLQVTLEVHHRPVQSDLGLNFPLTKFNTDSLNNWNSFPSDHAMFFFALGTGLWTVNRAAGLIAFIWTIVIVDLPRVYLGIHHPSDVIFGILFGFVGMRAFLALPCNGWNRCWRAGVMLTRGCSWPSCFSPRTRSGICWRNCAS
jgi:undecaprenyl-diphosphatase